MLDGLRSDLCSMLVNALLYSISCYVELCYNCTWLYDINFWKLYTDISFYQQIKALVW